MGHAIIVGDACSGKSTVMELLSAKGFNVVFEEGLPVIPFEVENDKFLSNKWFIDYYHKREKNIVISTIFEYVLHFQYPFTIAQRKTGKITPGQEVMLVSYLSSLTTPLDLSTLVFHFTLDNSTILSRLGEKKLFKPIGHTAYLDMLRSETQRYFSSRTRYFTIDVTSKTPQEVCEWVEEILKNEGFERG